MMQVWSAWLNLSWTIYRKGLSTWDAVLCVSHTMQTALESGKEARIVQIDFSAAFDMINH